VLKKLLYPTTFIWLIAINRDIYAGTQEFAKDFIEKYNIFIP